MKYAAATSGHQFPLVRPRASRPPPNSLLCSPVNQSSTRGLRWRCNSSTSPDWGKRRPGTSQGVRRSATDISLRLNRRVANPDLVEALRALLLRRDNRIARLRRLRNARTPQRLKRRRRIRRVVKPRHNLDIQRNTADKSDNTGLKWISSNRPQQFRRRHHRDCRIDKSRFIACYNDIRASGKRGTILNLILKIFCEICDCISNDHRSDGNYR